LTVDDALDFAAEDIAAFDADCLSGPMKS
jgi:hypothetical protein